MNVDVAAHQLAGTRHGVVTRAELLALGMSPHQIQRRRSAGGLVPVQPAVFAVAGWPASFDQRIWAAVLAAGPGAVASHQSAARLWGLRGAASDRVEVAVPGTALPRLRAARVHRSALLESPDKRVHRGISLTRPERTLVDCAAVVPGSLAGGMVESAVHMGLTTIDRAWTYLSRYGGPGVAGSRALRGILLERQLGGGPTESALEDLALGVLRRHGLPPPVRQHWIVDPGGPRVRVDLAYPALRCAVEVDSARWHSDSVRYRADRAKWNLLTRLGWALVILTEFDLRERPPLAALDVATVIRRRAGSVRVA